ncbi:cytochrome d ubiquinol oxidase subunit II [Gallalistipes aquisgranensis]|uniref:cytochrome d ubiquinol oxidase subunit II n=1 Tax=Gallalistipes aquisgranensis TaxID=2779358 RepID=UPI001CF8CBDE|nr:cytochrome d ubiquinol oxidase subunit II [Gallalistipes aquisgranensis]MBE5032639.1 cytochrome d ubiquinol oxidase subunit II [Gallalistipes aquisgranensis]
MDTYVLLQHYWWFLISLLGGLLVFLLFVQGGQGMLYTVGKSGMERDMIVNALGRKWETTFTTLVTFGGAFFASFPLFYSTSFGGAFYVWMLILLVFVIQAVAYEFRRKADNFLGEKTYEWFLMINGVLGALLLGVAVGTLFTGANFTVNRLNLANVGGDTTISQWTTPWRGLDALADYRNWALGLAVLFLSRVLGAQYFLNTIDDKSIRTRSRRQLWFNGVPFVLCFLLFLVSILLSDGWAVDPATGTISVEPYKYWHNLLAMPLLFAALTAGVLAVLTGIVRDLRKESSTQGIWWSGSGTVVTVVCLFLLAGYNDTAYYPSLSDMQSSLTIYNSSSSEFTLTAMSIVSVLIPFVVAYIWYAWRAMNRRKITREEIASADEHLY